VGGDLCGCGIHQINGLLNAVFVRMIDIDLDSLVDSDSSWKSWWRAAIYMKGRGLTEMNADTSIRWCGPIENLPGKT
jgi:hypothetical protein